jgi:hypothetical protein
MSLCNYKNIFGEPKKGAHSYRIFDIAIVDVVLTIFVAYIISLIGKVSFIKTCIVLFSLGIILHRLFCVDTTVGKFISSII